ncbi:MAG: response regulator transcription factor [Candidatus Zixiibacteriota bacterium]
MNEQILVIEDESDLQHLIQYNLSRKGYEVTLASSAEQALPLLRSRSFHLIILDVMLPGMDGFQFCRLLKADQSLRHVPVLMVTALAEDADVVSGLELGAEDYVTKPFSPSVMVARVRALLRRHRDLQVHDLTPLKMDCLEILPGPHTVLVGGKEVELSLTEFRILHALAKSPGWVFTRYQILDEVRGEGYIATDRVVDVHITSLRRKLGAAGECIETVRGVGYRFRRCDAENGQPAAGNGVQN